MGDTVVLAPKFLDELNMLSESRLSSSAALVDNVIGKYNGIDLISQVHLTNDICRGPFTRNLAVFLPRIAGELRTAMTEQLSQSTSTDAVEICITACDLLFSFIHRISSLVFVGKEHCHNPIWTDAVTNLPVDVEITKFILLPFPYYLRRFIAPLVPQRNRIMRQRAAVRDLLFSASKELAAKEGTQCDEAASESGRDADAHRIATRLLLLTAAALHTSSMAITHAIFDLCTRPEYMKPFRAEAQAALAQGNGEWKLSTLKRLHRLDNFLKESQRVNQSAFLGFDRKVMSPISLSDNKTVLPPGATISIPGGPMARDPTFYNDPYRFDPLRFYRRSGKEGDDTTTTTTDSSPPPPPSQQDYTGIERGNLSWGSGRFTCPGR
ncbi:cytochrome P450 [Bombardia bombarda]|uniref:Cytochrome P450 n=1 Tax=Bombardia bombarda TaxID=252184 RepID=A0AA39WNB2_9PEZI|nr:cytochrome P450 [Bombardia bombarda]